ncbi:MAG: M20 family metallopeptidase [Haloferacaceae archaeon]
MTEDELVALTRDLVEVPSHEDAGEREAGDLVERWLRAETDGAVRRDDHGNVFARRAVGTGPTLALVGHHDVVPPAESQVAGGGDRLAVESDGERLYGRGTADMKGALAAAMLAFRDADPATDLVFASFVAEEQGGLGAQAAVEDGFAPDHAVVCEGSTGYSAPGVTDVAVAHRGRRAVTVEARGEAGHASEPEAGANAVYRACDAVAELRAVEPPETTVLGQPMAGLLTVTGIEGGEAWNVVPERCELTVDERTVPDARVDLGRVERVEGVSTTVDQDLPPMACSDPRLADAALAAAREAQAGAPEHVIKPHATDAGRLAAAGTACVVVGPSEPGEAHTADESASIETLVRCRRIYEAVTSRARRA